MSAVPGLGPILVGRVAGLAAFAVLGTVAMIVAVLFVAAAFAFSRG